MANMDCFKLRFTAPRMNAGSDEAEIMLYGEIIQNMPEEWKFSKDDKSASEFDKLIKEVRANGAKKLILRINSPGGIVTEAVAMRGILNAAGFDEIIIRIEGLCASAATVIATLPSAHVQIAQGSEYMIHNPWTWDCGNADQFERTLQHLRSEEATARAFYEKKTGQSDEQIKAWMDAETWFTAEEAMKNGFCDELLAENEGSGKIAACVTKRTMSAMKALYRNVPSALNICDDVSNTEPEAATGDVTEYKSTEEESIDMDVTNMTPEQLHDQNPALYESVMRIGGEQERQRLQDIEDLTPTGYEKMAEEARVNGTSAMDYHKMIIRAQRERGQQFMRQRAEEVSASSNVKGGASEDASGKNHEQEINDYATEMAELAKATRANVDGGMY